MPEPITIPTRHRDAISWCRRHHPRIILPDCDCDGELDRVDSITPDRLGLGAYGCEVAILACRGCGSELAIGRGTDEMAAGLAPGLHGRLLWVDTDGRFAYQDPEFKP